MSTTTYFIIGGIALAFTIYLVIIIAWTKKRKKRQLDEFNARHDDRPLTKEEKRLLAFGAILSYFRGEKILGIKPDTGLDSHVLGLKEQWGITNSIEAKETLNGLLELHRSREYESLLQQPSGEIAKIQKSIAKGLKVELGIVENVKSAYAWDVCRAVGLAKWCYWLGYLSDQEMWGVLKEVSEIASSMGTDWTEYTISFLLGRTIQGFDLDDIIIESKQILNGKVGPLGKVEDIDVFSKCDFELVSLSVN